jgi:hypothetical protein
MCPKSGEKVTVTIDPARPVSWRRKVTKDSTSESYEWPQLAGKYKVELGGLVLQVMQDQRWVELRADTSVFLAVQASTDEATRLKEVLPGGNLNLEVEVLRFEFGQDLLDMVAELKTELQPGEVVQ